MHRKNKKEEIIQAAKENKELMDFVKSITKEERDWIKEQRKFQEIKPQSPTWKVALTCDAVRTNLRMTKLKLQKRLWNIDDITNKIKRLENQLKPGETINECVKDGITMNKDELRNYITHHLWLRDGEVAAIPQSLAEMRNWVGHKDVNRKIVMTLKEFDEFVDSVDKNLQEKGYHIFKEVE